MLIAALHYQHTVIFVVFYQSPDFPVEIGFFGVRVIFDEHYLRSDFEFEGFPRVIHAFGEDTLDVGGESQFFGRELVEFSAVDIVRLVVVGGEGDVAVVIFGGEIGQVAGVQQLYARSIHLVVSHLVEQIDKALVVLSVDVVELDAEVGGVAEDVAAEEVGGVVVGGEDFPIFGFGHGCKLVYVTDHQHLYAAEGPGGASGATKHGIYAV